MQESTMASNQPPEHFADAPLCTVKWEGEDVPQGCAEVTFLIPETGRRWSGRTVADLTIKDKTMTTNRDRAAKVIDRLRSKGKGSYLIAADLDAAGVLAPDLPAPHAVEGDEGVCATEWRPNYGVLRTDVTGGAAAEVEFPAGAVWVEPGGVIGLDTDHSEMYLSTDEARALALALLAATEHAPKEETNE